MEGAPPAEDQPERKMRGELAKLALPGVAFDLRSHNTEDAKWQLHYSSLNIDPGSWLAESATGWLGETWLNLLLVI